MTRNAKLLLLMSSLLAVAMVANACEISLPMVDCSGINQPDSGGLVCLGLNAIAIPVSLVAILIALLLGLGAPSPY